MIREKRDREELRQYYEKFLQTGVVDHNVHPWVAESWKRCLARKIDNNSIQALNKLSDAELAEKLSDNRGAIEFMDGIYEDSKQYFEHYKLNMALFDEQSYLLKNYGTLRYSEQPLYMPGTRFSERDIGTTSSSIAKEHKAPFLLFRTETWVRELHPGDVCSAPVLVDGCLRYVVSFFSVNEDIDSYDWLVSLLLTIKYTMEKYLSLYEKVGAIHSLLDTLPLAVYCIRPGGKVTYANSNGEKRLGGSTNLSEVFLNYEHIPINKGFHGTPSYHREVAWIAKDRTYEDIATIIPQKTGDEVTYVIAATIPVEELRNVAAHATGYSARYDIFSMVGEDEGFVYMQNKATRVAKGDSNVLLQGEPGTGKQRLAHGMHQASPRAAAPLIVARCGKVAESVLDAELFGYGDESVGWVAGKLELANTGTLFIDEIEKLPVALGDKLARSLKLHRLMPKAKKKINVRLIAASDSNLKRLSEKGLFSKELYELLSKVVIRVPALRDRAADVELLAEHILMEMAEQQGLQPKKLSPTALTVLRECSWPGNIKQLQSVLEMAFFHTPGQTIGAEHIKLPGNSTVGKSWKHDKDAFVEAWKAAGGNISKLGIMLDVSRVTLYRYLKKYGLDKNARSS